MTSMMISQSDNSRQPSSFEFGGNVISVKYDKENTPWFDGPEVCRAIKVANPSDAYMRLDSDEKSTLAQIEPESRTSGSSRVYVNESGLYGLILRSDKPEAKAFRKYVTSEVLPSIRKTGKFEVDNAPKDSLDVLEGMVSVLRSHQRQITEVVHKQADQAIEIESIKEELLDRDFYTVREYCSKQRINVTSTVKNAWGKVATALTRERGIERKEKAEGGYTVGRYHVTVLQDACVAKPKHGNQLSLFEQEED